MLHLALIGNHQLLLEYKKVKKFNMLEFHRNDLKVRLSYYFIKATEAQALLLCINLQIVKSQNPVFLDPYEVTLKNDICFYAICINFFFYWKIIEKGRLECTKSG